jgi:hypothetical protein
MPLVQQLKTSTEAVVPTIGLQDVKDGSRHRGGGPLPYRGC